MVLEIFAGFIMLVLSLLGIAVNIYFITATFSPKQYQNVFYTFCRTRAIANTVMALLFLAWAVPCTFLGYIFLPQLVNSIVGQLAGWGAYIIGPVLQFCISINRFVACCLPMYYRKTNGKLMARVVLVITMLIGSVFFGLGLSSPQCSFHFNVTFISWLPEESQCSWDLAYFILYCVGSLFAGATAFNLVSFICLTKHWRRQRQFLQQNSTQEKDRNNWRLLMQNIIQDSFYLVDLIAVTFAVKWCDKIMYQFFVNSALWQIHIIADGLVMIMLDRRLLCPNRVNAGLAISRNTT